MKVTVVVFNPAEAHKAKGGLAKLKKGVNEFRRDIKDNRVDMNILESFVQGLRSAANYFEGFLEDAPEEVKKDSSESSIKTENH